jgi:hypothetical protein
MAPAPAVDPDWLSGIVMILVGVAATAVGVIGVRRRDLAGE